MDAERRLEAYLALTDIVVTVLVALALLIVAFARRTGRRAVFFGLVGWIAASAFVFNLYYIYVVNMGQTPAARRPSGTPGFIFVMLGMHLLLGIGLTLWAKPWSRRSREEAMTDAREGPA